MTNKKQIGLGFLAVSPVIMLWLFLLVSSYQRESQDIRLDFENPNSSIGQVLAARSGADCIETCDYPCIFGVSFVDGRSRLMACDQPAEQCLCIRREEDLEAFTP